jgi:hypothetical protein
VALASCQLVIPSWFARRTARSSPTRISSRVCGGMCCWTSSCADSRSVPTAFPWASRTITPFTGSRVSRVIPAMASAREFAHPLCPSADDRKAGRPGTRESSKAAVGVPPAKSGEREAAAANPRCVRVARIALGHHLTQPFDRRNVGQVALAQLHACAHRVHVRIDEARHQQPIAQRDDARVRPDQRIDPVLVANVDDAVLPDGDRVRFGLQ